MADENSNENTALIFQPTCMESVNRITRLPVVDSTIKSATSFYERVKCHNEITYWIFFTAESTLCKAVDVGKPIVIPVIKNFEGPIKTLDDALCGGLDYIETKVPSVKLIILQVYNNTVTPAVQSALSYSEPALKTARSLVEPAYEMAKAAVEPAVEIARTIVEHYVQPALDKAQVIKDKVDEYIHVPHQEGETVECYECHQMKKKMEQEYQSKRAENHDTSQPEQEQH